MSPRPTNARSQRLLEDLAEEELQQIEADRRTAAVEAAVAAAKPFIPHPPSPLQGEFLALDCEEALFGGSAGGGKSVGLLYDALKNVDVPGYVAGLFRLSGEDWSKPDSLLTRAHSWFHDTGARWDAKLDSFRFPSGALIHFGSGHLGQLKRLKDAYKGLAFQMLGFDELQQWPEDCYRWLIGERLRPGENEKPIPLRARATANADGEPWVRERFVDGAVHARGTPYREDFLLYTEDEVPLPSPRVYASPPSDDADELARKLGRKAQGAHFVPSFLSDNPGYQGARGDDYRMRLVSLDPVSRAQIEGGDWWVNAAGKLFRKEMFQYLEVVPAGVLEQLRSWDLAGTAATKPGQDPAWTAGPLLLKWPDPADPRRIRIVVADLQHFREDPGPTEERVLSTSRLDGPRVRVLFEQEPGSAGKTVVHNFRRLMSGVQVEAMTKTGAKEEYWRPLSALAHSGMFYLVRAPWNAKLVEQLVALPGSRKKDIADALAQGVWKMLGFNRSVEVPTTVPRSKPRGLRAVEL
jgi:phage terminase large subunit-like protein